jgi:hypothetical protein
MDCATREVYTVRVDSAGVSTPYSTFTAYLPIPLRNVVKAELLSASIKPQYSNAVSHVYVDELVSNFITRASPAYTTGLSSTTSNVGVSTLIANQGLVERAFVSIPISSIVQGTDNFVVWTRGNDFETDVEYINPIRQLKTLTITFYDGKTGNLQTMNDVSFFTFRIYCAKNNKCDY